MKKTSVHVPDRTIGIDLGDETSTFCVVNAEGNVIEEDEFPMTRLELDQAFGHEAAARVVVEASTQSHWVVCQLESMGHEVIIANPRRVHLISESVRKTDRNDAHTLARLGRLDPDFLHPVHSRSEECLAVRALLRARTQLVRTRARLITLIRAECKVHGVRIQSASAPAFGLRTHHSVPEVLRAALAPLYETLDVLGEKIVGYDKEVERLCREEFTETGVLRQVRGVGPLVALSFVTCLGDPKLFEDSRMVGPYLGLTPRVHQSGKSNPNLRISKHGDRATRTLLVTAAAHIMRRSSPDTSLKRLGRRIAGRGNPRDRARGRIAVARKLAVLLHRLWTTGEVYEPLRAAPAKA